MGREKPGGVYVGIVVFVISTCIYFYNIYAAEKFWPPNYYYSKWYYALWLVSLFFIVSKIKVAKVNLILSRMAANTFTVYLGHLPVLLYITGKSPIESFGEACVLVLALFGMMNLTAEIFRKLPVLRKII